MKTNKASLKPRKTPVQARSSVTVDAILEAALQVLIQQGRDKLTTTRVADRAGVSVGTLYQYFGDKDSILAGVLAKHLTLVTEAVEKCCETHQGGTVDVMVKEVIDAFFQAKTANVAASKALYGIAADLDGDAVVNNLLLRAQTSLIAMLDSATDIKFVDTPMVAFIVSTAMMGPVQTLLSIDAPQDFSDQSKEHLEKMIRAYLSSVAEEAVKEFSGATKSR